MSTFTSFVGVLLVNLEDPPVSIHAGAIALKLLLVLFLVAANGYFVAAEFAAVGARTSRLETLAKKGSWLAGISIDIKRRLDLYLSICHLGMMNGCGYGKKDGDARCPLKGACRP